MLNKKHTYIYIYIYTVVNIWSGSKKWIKVVLRQERILVVELLWKILIHFKYWLLFIYIYILYNIYILSKDSNKLLHIKNIHYSLISQALQG